MNFFNFLNTNSGAIQAIAIGILVAVTIWYALSTSKMVNIMRKEYSLHSRPYLSLTNDINRIFFKQDKRLIQLQFPLVNVGSVPVKFYVDDVRLHNTLITPDRAPLILFPSQDVKYLSNVYISGTDIKDQGAGMEGSIKLVFWAEGIPEEKYSFVATFKLTPDYIFLLDEEVRRLQFFRSCWLLSAALSLSQGSPVNSQQLQFLIPVMSSVTSTK